MHIFFGLCLLISLPMCMGLNCYICTGAASSSCNDPFNKTGSGVTQTALSAYTYCMKVVAAGVVTRSGTSACAEASVLSIQTACCQTDLCNGARVNTQIAFIWLVSLVVILVKIQWA